MVVQTSVNEVYTVIGYISVYVCVGCQQAILHKEILPEGMVGEINES